MKHVFPVLLLGLGLVMGSATEASAIDPVIVGHARPTTRAVDVGPFLDAGCVRSGSDLDCSAAPAIRRFGCFGNSLAVDETLGGLSPRVAIAECNAQVRDETEAGIVRLGCRLRLERRYLVAMRGRFELLDTPAAFVDRFAPVTSAAEALAFAVALTTADPEFTIDTGETREFLVDRIETTFARRSRGGFRVRLFDMELCGCGLHPTSAVDYFVSTRGRLSVLSREPVYRFTNAVCID